MVKSILQYLWVLHLPNLHHLDMIYWCHMVVCVLGLHFTLEWPRLGGNGSVFITVSVGATFTKLNWHQLFLKTTNQPIHLNMIYWCHVVICVFDLHFTLEWPWIGRNGLVYITVPMGGATFTKLTQLLILTCSTDAVWRFVSLTYISHFSDQDKMAIAGPLRWFPSQ